MIDSAENHIKKSSETDIKEHSETEEPSKKTEENTDHAHKDKSTSNQVIGKNNTSLDVQEKVKDKNGEILEDTADNSKKESNETQSNNNSNTIKPTRKLDKDTKNAQEDKKKSNPDTRKEVSSSDSDVQENLKEIEDLIMEVPSSDSDMQVKDIENAILVDSNGNNKKGGNKTKTKNWNETIEAIPKEDKSEPDPETWKKVSSFDLDLQEKLKEIEDLIFVDSKEEIKKERNETDSKKHNETLEPTKKTEEETDQIVGDKGKEVSNSKAQEKAKDNEKQDNSVDNNDESKIKDSESNDNKTELNVSINNINNGIDLKLDLKLHPHENAKDGNQTFQKEPVQKNPDETTDSDRKKKDSIEANNDDFDVVTNNKSLDNVDSTIGTSVNSNVTAEVKNVTTHTG